MYVYNIIIVFLILGVFLDVSNSRIRRVFFNFNFIIIYIISTFRYGIGADYFQYVELFGNAATIFDVDFSYFINNSRDIEYGYLFLESLVKTFTDDYIYFISIYNFIMFSFLFKGITKFKNSNIQLFIFFCSVFLLYFIDTYRQAMAMAIFYYALHFLLSKNLWKYVTLCFIASLFHKVALIAIPAYFIANLNGNRVKFLLLILLCMLFYYTNITGKIITILNDNLNNFSFIRRVHYYYFVKESGATMEFSAFAHRVAMLFLILFYFYKVERKIVNLISLYFILFFALANIGVLAGRISALFLLCYMCYFSSLIYSLRKDHKFMVAIIMVLYFLIVFYKDLFRVHHIFGNDVYLPYKWIFM